MLLSIFIIVLALRQGLVLRQARKRGKSLKPKDIRLHVAAAKPAVLMLLLGATLGPLSAVYLRGWAVYETAHAWIATLSAVFCVATAVLGLRLLRGESRFAEVHGWLALTTVFAAVASIGTGLVLLP